MAASLTPDVSGSWTISVSGVGAARLYFDGELVGDTTGASSGAGILGLFTTPVEAEVDLVAGATHQVTAELDAAVAEGPIAIAGLTIEVRPPTRPDAVEQAVRRPPTRRSPSSSWAGTIPRPRAWMPPPWTCRPTKSSSSVWSRPPTPARSWS